MVQVHRKSYNKSSITISNLGLRSRSLRETSLTQNWNHQSDNKSLCFIFLRLFLRFSAFQALLILLTDNRGTRLLAMSALLALLAGHTLSDHSIGFWYRPFSSDFKRFSKPKHVHRSVSWICIHQESNTFSNRPLITPLSKHTSCFGPSSIFVEVESSSLLLFRVNYCVTRVCES